MGVIKCSRSEKVRGAVEHELGHVKHQGTPLSIISSSCHVRAAKTLLVYRLIKGMTRLKVTTNGSIEIKSNSNRWESYNDYSAVY